MIRKVMILMLKFAHYVGERKVTFRKDFFVKLLVLRWIGGIMSLMQHIIDELYELSESELETIEKEIELIKLNRINYKVSNRRYN